MNAVTAAWRARTSAMRPGRPRPAPHTPPRPARVPGARQRRSRGHRCSGAGRSKRDGSRRCRLHAATDRGCVPPGRPRHGRRAMSQSCRDPCEIPPPTRMPRLRPATDVRVRRRPARARSPQAARRCRSAPAGKARPAGADSCRAPRAPARAARRSVSQDAWIAKARRRAGAPGRGNGPTRRPPAPESRR